MIGLKEYKMLHLVHLTIYQRFQVQGILHHDVSSAKLKLIC